jgi:hypothetical protein
VYHEARKLQSLKEREERAKQRNEGGVPTLLSRELNSESSWLIDEAPKLAQRKFERYLRLMPY